MLEWLVTRSWFYWLGCAVFRLYARIFQGARVHGLHNVPKTGAVVVASNHFSSLDPPMLGAFFPREIHFMGKRELFEKLGTRLLMLGFRVFPVNRNGQDLAAMRHAIRDLKSGMPVGVFVQGTRSAEGVPALQGAAFMALRSGAQVQPAACYRQGRNFHIVYDKLIPTGDHDTASLTAELTQRINALLPAELHIGDAVQS